MTTPTGQGQVLEQAPAVWPSTSYGMRHATVGSVQRRAEIGYPVVADGDTLAIMRGDLNRIADINPSIWEVTR